MLSQSILGRVYRKQQSREQIGKVIQVSGEVVAYGNFDRPLQYLKKGDVVSLNIALKTRNNSRIRIQFKNTDTLYIGPNSQLYLRNGRKNFRYHGVIEKGQLLYKSKTPSIPIMAFSVQGEKDGHTGSYLLINYRRGQKKIMTKNKRKVYRVKNIAFDITRKNNETLKLDELLKAKPRKAILANKKKTSSPSKKSATKAAPSTSHSTSASEIADIFGDESLAEDTIPNTPAPPSPPSNAEAEALAMFGDEPEEESKPNTQNTPASDSELEALSMFGDDPSSFSEVKPKKKKKKRKKKTIVYEEKDEEFKFDMSLNLRSAVYFNKPPKGSRNDSQFAHGEGRLNVGKKFDLEDGSSITTNGWLELGNRKHVYGEIKNSFDDRDELRSRFVLSELYFLESFDNFDLTLGKKVYKQGKGMLFSPSDKLSPTDTIIPMAPLAIGGWLVSLDYYIGANTFTFLISPRLSPGKSPGQYSRWSNDISGRELPLTSDYPKGLNSENTQALFKYETTFWGTDWFLSAFNGPNPQPSFNKEITVINNEPEFVIVRDYIPVSQYAGGFSTTFGSLEFHGEYMRQYAGQGKDDSYDVTLLGYRYTMDVWPTKIGLNQIDWILEYVKENIIEPISYPFYASSSIIGRVFQHSVLGTLIFQVSDRFSLNYDYQFDIKDSGSAMFFGFSYQTKDSGSYRAKLEMFNGERESLFGIWDANDNISVEYTYTY